MTLASLWLPWDAGGSLWGALGSQGALLGVTLPLWDTLGSQGELLVIWVENGRPFPSKFGAFAMPAHKNWPAGILLPIPDPPDPPDRREVRLGPQLPTHLHSRQGLG